MTTPTRPQQSFPTAPGTYPPIALSADDVQQRMGTPVLQPADVLWLSDCVAWVAEYAGRQKVQNNLSDAAAFAAGVLHTQRLFNRRSSIGGFVGFDVGLAVRVTKSDPDIVTWYRADYPRIG